MAHPRSSVVLSMLLFFCYILLHCCTLALAQTLPCTPAANGAFSLQSSALLASSNETLTFFLEFAPTAKQGSYVTQVQVTLGTQQVFAYNVTSQLNESTIALNWGSPTNSTGQATLSIENNTITGTFGGRPLKPLAHTTAAGPDIVFADGKPLPTALLLPAEINAQDFNTTINQLATIVSSSAQNCNPNPNSTLPSNVTTRGMPLDGSDVLFRREVNAHYSNPSTLASCIACNVWVATEASAALGFCAGACAGTLGLYCQQCYNDVNNYYNQGLFNCANGGSCCPIDCGTGAAGYADCCYSNESCAGNRSGKCCAGNYITSLLDNGLSPCNGQLCCDPNAGESCFIPVDEPNSALCSCPQAQQCGWGDGNSGNPKSPDWNFQYCCPDGTACANSDPDSDATLCCPTDMVGCGTSSCCPAAAGCANPTTGQCCPTDTVSCGTACCKDGFCANSATSQCCPTDSQACGPTCCTGGSFCASIAEGLCCPAGTALIDGICCASGDYYLCGGKCCSGACCGGVCYNGITSCPKAPTCSRPCSVPANCGQGESCSGGCCFKVIE